MGEIACLALHFSCIGIYLFYKGLYSYEKEKGCTL